MDTYLMMLYVTLDQESALKKFFDDQGWSFCKPDLSVTTDKLGPTIGAKAKDQPPPVNSGKRKASSSVRLAPKVKFVKIVSSNTGGEVKDSCFVSQDSKTCNQNVKEAVEKGNPYATLTRILDGKDSDNKRISDTIIEKEKGKQSDSCGVEYQENEVVAGDDNEVVNDEINDDDDNDLDDLGDDENDDTDVSMEDVSEEETEEKLDGTETTRQKGTEVDVKSSPGHRTAPRRFQKKYRSYSQEAMIDAYKAVKEKGLAVTRAAFQFGVPEQTLRDRVKGYIDPFDLQTTKKCFSNDEELALVEHIETMVGLGYGYSNTQLQHVAGELAFHLGKKSSNKPLSNNWLYAFLKRWNSRLISLIPSKPDSNRAQSANPKCVKTYHEVLSAIFDKYNLDRKLQNIDETGLQPDHRPVNIITPTNSNSQAVTSPRSATTTSIACTNSDGNSPPPVFVLKEEYLTSY